MSIIATEYIMTYSKGGVDIYSYVQRILTWLADHFELNSVPALAAVQIMVQMPQP